MASEPDSRIGKPWFCRNLRWPTSNTFRLQWITKTAVEFRNLEGIMNKDGENEYPTPVWFGRDGQEVSRDAGIEVCYEMDRAEANKKKSFDH